MLVRKDTAADITASLRHPGCSSQCTPDQQHCAQKLTVAIHPRHRPHGCSGRHAHPLLAVATWAPMTVSSYLQLMFQCLKRTKSLSMPTSRISRRAALGGSADAVDAHTPKENSDLTDLYLPVITQQSAHHDAGVEDEQVDVWLLCTAARSCFHAHDSLNCTILLLLARS